MAGLDTRLAEAEAALAALDEAIGKSARSLLQRDGAISRMIDSFEAVWKTCLVGHAALLRRWLEVLQKRAAAE